MSLADPIEMITTTRVMPVTRSDHEPQEEAP